MMKKKLKAALCSGTLLLASAFTLSAEEEDAIKNSQAPSSSEAGNSEAVSSAERAASPAAAAPSEALKLMKEGRFQEALPLFEKEIRESPANIQLKQRYSELKKNLRREELFREESNPELLAKLGRQLKSFYYSLGLFEKAEAVERKIHEVSPTTENAANLGATLLNLNKNREAAELFSKTDLSDAKSFPLLCAALAYARSGDARKASELAARCRMESLSANELLLFARTAAACGNCEKASGAVAKILENTPPSRRKGLKDFVQEEDFSRIRDSKEFRSALETPSRVKDSCAGCPNRGTSRCDGDGKKHSGNSECSDCDSKS